MATDRELLKRAQKGLYNATGLTDHSLAVDKTHRRILIISTTDVGANTDHVVPLLVTTHAIKLITLKVAATAAVTADPTNYKSLEPKYNDGAGGASTSLGTAMTTASTGFSVTGGPQPRSFTLTDANVEVASGKTLYMDVTTPGTGVDLGKYVIQLEYEEI